MTLRDVDPDELARLTEIFRRYGADDPESWARSQLEEGIPQLAIFSFAKAMWTCVVDEDDDHWIDQEIQWAKDRPNDPCAQIGPALSEMLSKGVSRRAIIDLVRVIQYGALYHVASLIDGSHLEDVPIQHWTLYQVDENDHLAATIQGLHEVLLSLDPTGREMRPRESDTEDLLP
jgi:hypothetical protein